MRYSDHLDSLDETNEITTYDFLLLAGAMLASNLGKFDLKKLEDLVSTSMLVCSSL